MRALTLLLICSVALAAPGDWVEANQRIDELAGQPANVAVPALIADLDGQDGFLRRRAIQTLSLFGERAAPAVDALIQALYDADPLTSREAFVALHWIGRPAERAGPFLIEAVPQDYAGAAMPPDRRYLGRNLPRNDRRGWQSLRDQLADSDPEPAALAAYWLGRMGARARDAVPALRATLASKEWNPAGRAAEALGRIGVASPETAAALVTAAQRPQPFVRAKAITALGQLGPSGTAGWKRLLALGRPEFRMRILVASAKGAAQPELVGDWVAILDAKQPADLRLLALEALRRAGVDAAPAVPALLRILRHGESRLQLAAVEVLAVLGPAAEPAIELLVERGDRRAIGVLGRIGVAAHPALAKLTTDERSLIRTLAYRMLVSTGEFSPEALHALEAGLEDPDPAARRAAEESLELLPTRDDRGVPALLEKLGEASTSKQIAALGWRLERKAKPETLHSLLGAASWKVRLAALIGLVRTEPQSRERRIELLEPLANDANKEIRRLAGFHLQVLRRLTPADLPRLISDLESEDRAQRMKALAGLTFLGRAAVKAMDPVRERIERGDLREKQAAIRALGSMRNDAIPTLFALLGDSDLRIASAARDALADLGKPAREAARARRKDPNVRVRRMTIGLLRRLSAVDEYADWLDDADAQVRKTAIDALIGWRGERPVPGLLQALGNQDAEVVRRAAYALASRKSKAQEIAPALAPLLESPRAEIASAAGSSLGALGAPARPFLAKALESDDEGVRIAALHGLNAWGDEAGPLIAKAFDDGSVEVRLVLMKSAGAMRAAAPTILRALEGEDRHVRAAAIRALRSHPSVHLQALPKLLALLDEQFVRIHLLSLLMLIGDPAVEAALDSAQALRSDGIEWYFGRLHAKYVTLLLRRLDQPGLETRRIAVWALGCMGKQGRDAIPALEKLADDRELAADVQAALTRIRGK